MSSSWPRPSNTGIGRRPSHHGDSNNEEGEISSSNPWGPSRTDNAVRVPIHASTHPTSNGDSQSLPTRSDPRLDRLGVVPPGVPIPAGHRSMPNFRNDRDPRFKATSAASSGRLNPSSLNHTSTNNNNMYTNPGRRMVSDSHSPTHSGGIHPHNPSMSRSFSVPEVGSSRNEFHHSVDGGRDPSLPYIMDGIGVPMPGPKSALGGPGGGGGKFWKSNPLNMGPNSASNNNNTWGESSAREKKFTPWSSKPSFPLARAASLHEGTKPLDASDARPSISNTVAAGTTPFLNKFDRRAPPGGWERDRKIMQPVGGTTVDGPASNRDYYGPSISRDRPTTSGMVVPPELIQSTHDTIREEKSIDVPPAVLPTFHPPSDPRRSDGGVSHSLRSVSSEPDAMDVDRGRYDVPPHSDRLSTMGQDLPSSRQVQESKDVPIAHPTVVVTVPDVKSGTALETLNPPPSPDKKNATTMIRIAISSLANEEKIGKAELAVKRLSEIMSHDELNLIQMDGSILLPSTQQIMLGISNMDAKIKESERDLAQVRMEREELLKREEEEVAQKLEKELEVKKKRALELTQQYEEIRKVEQVKRDIDRERCQNDMNMLKSAVQALAVRRNAQVSEVQDQFKVSFSREYDRMNELVLANIESVQSAEWNTLTPHIQGFIEQVHGHLEAEISMINELASALKGLGSDDVLCDDQVQAFDESKEDGKYVITAGLKALSTFLKDERTLMSDVVSSVLLESRKRARESHLDALSLIPSDDAMSTSCVDEHEWSNEHWSQLARLVTGPENALYTEPSEAPLFEEINAEYLRNRELVREHIRSKKRKLHNRWKELSLEYLDLQRSRVNEPEFAGYATEVMIMDPNCNYETQELGVRGNNPYRRPRRVANIGNGSNTIGSDVVRSEYEQEQIIAKLTAQEALEKKIIHGGCTVPRQRCKVEKTLFISYHDSLSNRRVHDPLKESEDLRCRNPWSDMEKCIFLDKFLQHPKDFRKIASYLKNKSVRDCIAFYYDSKQSVPYKAALKDHLIRRKRRGEATNWEATMQAAVSVGATISTGISAEKPVIFSLPIDDNSYSTRHFHPLRRERIINIADEDSRSPITHATHGKNTVKVAIPVGKLFSVDISPVSLPMSNDDSEKKINQDGGSWDSESQMVIPTMAKDDKALGESSNRKIQKWTKEEKKTFLSAFEQHGKNWALLAQAVGTKGVNQIKNYYYDNKKVINKQVVSKDSGNDLDILSRQDKEKMQSVDRLEDDDLIRRFPGGNEMIGGSGRGFDAFNYLNFDSAAQQQAEMWTHPSLHHPLALALERQRQNQMSVFHHLQPYDFPVYTQPYGLPFLGQNILLSHIHDRAWEQALQRSYVQDNMHMDIGSIAAWASGRQQHEANFALPDGANYLHLGQANMPSIYHPFTADGSPRANNSNAPSRDSLDRFDNFQMNN